MQAVSHLLDWGGRFVNINEKNLEGKTALDILEGQRRQGVDNSEMRVILESAGALTATSLPTVTSSHKHYLTLPGSCERKIIIYFVHLVKKGISDEKRNKLLVVAALLVTVTFQAAITPPGGLWQDDLFKPNTTDVLRSRPDDLYKLNITAPHRAGSAIAKDTFYFMIFVGFNSMILLSSIAGIVVLVPPDQIVGLILSVVSLVLYMCYQSSLLITTKGSEFSETFYLILPFIFFIAVIIAVIGLVFLTDLIWTVLKKKRIITL